MFLSIGCKKGFAVIRLGPLSPRAGLRRCSGGDAPCCLQPRGLARLNLNNPAFQVNRPGPGWSVAKANRKLLLDGFCQQSAQGSWVNDVEAEQGGAVALGFCVGEAFSKRSS